MEVEGEWRGSLWLLLLLVVPFMEEKKKHGREGFCFGRVECERWQLGRCCESGSKSYHLTMSLLRDCGLQTVISTWVLIGLSMDLFLYPLAHQFLHSVLIKSREEVN